jgi:predicted phage terminase large subunit-like protein
MNSSFDRFSDVPIPRTLEGYKAIEAYLEQATKKEYLNMVWLLSRADLYFLVRYVLTTKEYFGEENGIANEQWIFDRCREVQFDSDRVVDIWARFHWKSNIKTFANVIRHILIDPNTTVCILSHTRPQAKLFMAQIQREILQNKLLQLISYDPILGKQIFPDNPKDLGRNSLDDGIIVVRHTNAKEPTLSAHGLVDSLPVGPHYRIRVYDDVVTKDSVATSDMLKKTNQAYELSIPLGMPNDQAWYTGTFYSHDDTWHKIVSLGQRLRIHPCYEIDEAHSERRPNGTYVKLNHHRDKPVLYYADHLDQLFKEMGAGTESATADLQMLCNPNAGIVYGFKRGWLRYYHTHPSVEAAGKNLYILVDPANEKKKGSSYTVMWVIAAGGDKRFYLVDGVRDRLSLTERADKLFELHALWHPLEVRYEKYGLQADIAHIEYLQEQRGYRFHVEPVAGITRKDDRIERLVPLFEKGMFYLPLELKYQTCEGDTVDLVSTFIDEEYLPFPNAQYKDMLDAMARIAEPNLAIQWPDSAASVRRHRYDLPAGGQLATGWMGA